MGPFLVHSEFMPLPNPDLALVRTKLLDYFTRQRQLLVNEDHVIFSFEQDMKCGSILSLIEQVCWETGKRENRDDKKEK